jgi:post-segregation antitoxin (ccd killing protein)
LSVASRWPQPSRISSRVGPEAVVMDKIAEELRDYGLNVSKAGGLATTDISGEAVYTAALLLRPRP